MKTNTIAGIYLDAGWQPPLIRLWMDGLQHEEHAAKFD